MAQFTCIACGYVDHWQAGTCPRCGLENPFERADKLEDGPREQPAPGVDGPAPIASFGSGQVARFRTLPDVDAVLGGGLPHVCSVLCGGRPGLGKSTLALRICDAVGRQTRAPVWYVSAEMPPELVSVTARRARVSARRISLWWGPPLDVVAARIERDEPAIVVIDSLHRAAERMPAGLADIIEASNRVGCCAWVIAHATRDDPVGGPMDLQHDVDLVCNLAEGPEGARLLQVRKSRFGPSGEGAIEILGQRRRPRSSEKSAVGPSSSGMRKGSSGSSPKSNVATPKASRSSSASSRA